VRAAIGLIVVAAITIVGILVLSDATKYEGGWGPRGETRIDFSVDTSPRYHHDLEDAAASLFYACVSTVGWEHTTAPRLVSGSTFRATISPTLPEDSRRRMRGCMEDGTVDKLRGHVEDIQTVLAAPDDTKPADD
jgi:hypothetical protein